jgi:two-component system, cell cycle response regulator
VLLDLSMPNVTGLEVLKRIREDSETVRVPVVAITGYVAPGVETIVREAGADLFLVKPCLPHVAFGFITQLVRGAAPR